MRKIVNLNRDWEYTGSFDEAFASGSGSFCGVSLPHTCRETPFDYFDESIYQTVCGYRKRVALPREAEGKRVFLCIGAAAHSAQVYVEGVPVGERHLGGYTAFEVELTGLIAPGGEALVAIEVDSRESQDIPPFGHVIDYMTYGGLYREVYLRIVDKSFISDVFAKPGSDGTLKSEVTSENGAGLTVRQKVFFGEEEVCSGEFKAGAECALKVPGVRLWELAEPNLYTLVTELADGAEVIDRVETRIGFREAVFKADGFYLNGKKTKIIGLDRHQSYPYVGYAMPASIQRYDADILKYELGVSAVRTSHYPQSRHFIDRCDEIGLLVFTEIPGWQHIGGEKWQDIAVSHTAEMVKQYRNHPSVILWGVRINESADNDAFYKRTNETAHALDPTRQTGGVRCNKKSSLLEDVYTYNDFVHSGSNAGCEPKKNVTPDMSKGYLITEYCGHMFPTKTFDSEEHRLEHALRHARVLDSVAGEEDIAGSFGWCFFDYNTHKDFGSGDRICYHGVCDMFRNPKSAAAVYSSMREGEPVLEVSSGMDIGEHPASNRGRVYVFTNADSVRFYQNGEFISELTAKDSEYKNLRRPPLEITDYIGDRIEKNENFKPKQAKYVKDILNESTRFGMDKLSVKAKAKAAWLMLRYRMSFAQAYALYGKYIGNWGGKSTEFRFEAVKDGKVVKTVTRSAFRKMDTALCVSAATLREGATYDAACVRIRMTDQDGNVLPFYMGAAEIDIKGPLLLIGPKTAQLRGGMGGFYVKTAGEAGKASVTVTTEAGGKTIEFEIIREEQI